MSEIGHSLVSIMHYDVGYIDLEKKTSQVIWRGNLRCPFDPDARVILVQGPVVIRAGG